MKNCSITLDKQNKTLEIKAKESPQREFTALTKYSCKNDGQVITSLRIKCFDDPQASGFQCNDSISHAIKTPTADSAALITEAIVNYLNFEQSKRNLWMPDQCKEFIESVKQQINHDDTANAAKHFAHILNNTPLDLKSIALQKVSKHPDLDPEDYTEHIGLLKIKYKTLPSHQLADGKAQKSTGQSIC